MSTRVNTLFPTFARRPEEALPTTSPSIREVRAPWDAGRFAAEQISRLVRQVFWPGWPKPARHVVVAAVDDDTNVAGICLHIGENLAHQVEGRVGVIEANLSAEEFQDAFGVKAPASPNAAVPMGDVTHQIAPRLWLEPCTSLLGNTDGEFPPESAIEHLRHEFDFAVLHAAPAGSSSQALVLGRSCDGVILVLEAHCTHRAVAQAVKDALQAAKVRVLGAVLSGRKFPVPENFYRRL